MSHGDPKRVVGAYLTKVRKEKKSCSHRPTARSRRDASREGSGCERAGGPQPDHPRRPDVEHVRCDRGTLGIPRVEITDVAFLDLEASRRSSSTRARCRSGSRQSCPAHRRLRLRYRIVHRRRRVLLRHEHLSGVDAPRAARRRATRRLPSTVSTWSSGTYKLDVAVHKRDGYPYDYHRLLYTFASSHACTTLASNQSPPSMELLRHSPLCGYRRHKGVSGSGGPVVPSDKAGSGG